jgi:hypothetical protein
VIVVDAGHLVREEVPTEYASPDDRGREQDRSLQARDRERSANLRMVADRYPPIRSGVRTIAST